MMPMTLERRGSATRRATIHLLRTHFIVKRGVRWGAANATACRSPLSHPRTCLLRSKGRERMALCLPVLRACLKPTSNQSDTMGKSPSAFGGGLYFHNATLLQQYLMVANACAALRFIWFSLFDTFSTCTQFIVQDNSGGQGIIYQRQQGYFSEATA